MGRRPLPSPLRADVIVLPLELAELHVHLFTALIDKYRLAPDSMWVKARDDLRAAVRPYETWPVAAVPGWVRDSPEDVISVADAARLAGVSGQSVRRWLRRGEIPGYRDPAARYAWHTSRGAVIAYTRRRAGRIAA